MSTDTKEKLTSTERVANIGVEIELKKLGTVCVRELSLEALLKLGRQAAAVFEKVALQSKSLENASDDKSMAFVVELLADDETAQAFRAVAAATCDKPAKDFKDLGIADWLKWANAFKEVADWDEIKELFTQLGGMKALSNLMSKGTTTSQPSSTGSRPNTGGQRKRS